MKKYLTLFKQTFTEFGEDKAQRLGAALAYYTIFSIAPLLLIAIAIAGIAFGKSQAQEQIVGQIKMMMGSAGAAAITDMLKNAAKPKTGTLATIVGIVTLLLGASGVFGQLKDALNTIWNVEPKKTSGVMGFIKGRFLSLAMVFGIGFLLLVSLVFDAAISAMGDWIGARFPGGETLLQIIQLAISFGLITVLFAAMFRYLPDIHPSWHDVWFGAAFTSFLFVIGKFGLGIYLGKAAVGSAYGAAGSLVILLLWIYWSAQILFFGAEFTQVYARQHGSMAGDTSKEKAKSVAAPASGAGPASVQPKPERRPRAAAATPKPAGGFAKLAAGGAAGLFIGALVGGISTTMLVIKSVKKLLLFR